MIILKVDKRGRISLKKVIEGAPAEYYDVDELLTGEIILTPIPILDLINLNKEQDEK